MSSDSFENFSLSSESNSGTWPSSILLSENDGTLPFNDSLWEPLPKPKPKPKQEEGVTVIDLPETVRINPAVGWLVCIEGVDKGKSFRLVKGNNPIGRSGNGKTYPVSLTDQGISRKGACGVVVYNEKANQFFLTPGELTTNINPYLNDEILLSPKQLMPRARLEIAGDILIFVPFCNEKFKWNFDLPKEQAPAPAPRPAVPQEQREQIVRCPRGHYYNAAESKTCPYCETMMRNNDPDGAVVI